MFKSIGAFAVKFRFWIIAVWVIGAIAMAFLAPSLSQVGSMKESDFLPKNSDSQTASEMLDKYFPGLKAGSSVSLIFYNPQKISAPDLAYAQQVIDWLKSGKTTFKVESVTSVFDNPELAASLYSPDQTTMLINATLAQSAYESKSIATTQEIRDQLKNAPQGLNVYVSGEIGIHGDTFAALNKSINIATLITIILVIVLLIIIYRSPVAALLPVATIGIAFLVSRGIVGLIAMAGIPIYSQLDVFLVVLIFGIGTDYCLFLISRFREELGRNDSRVAAMRTTVGRIGAVITASALAVIVGLCSMYVARYQMMKTMGPMMGLAIFITLLASLTLAPALASVFGKKLFWPRHEETQVDITPKQSKFWSRVASLATGRPIIVGGIIIIIMLVPFFGLSGMHRSFDQMTEIPPNAESIQGYNILEKHYNMGEIDPMIAVVTAPEGKNISNPDGLAALQKVEKALLAVPGVVSVQSIVLPEGTGQTPAALTVSGQLGAIGDGIASSLTTSSTNASALLDPSLAQGFNLIGTYLGEISGNFTWVKNEASFKAILADLKNINDTIAAIKTGALVDNQLMGLSVQVMNAAQALSMSGAALTPEQIGLMMLTKGYIDELAAQYPQIKTQAGYQTAYPILTKIGAALVSSQPISMLPPDVQAVMAKLPDNLQQLSSALIKIDDNFRGQNAYLFSQTLARASTSSSPADTLKLQLVWLTTDLQTLGSKFKTNGDPIFLSPSMIASSPQLKTLVNMFISDDSDSDQECFKSKLERHFVTAGTSQRDLRGTGGRTRGS
jgi:RND superfamily putative drug exporter